MPSCVALEGNNNDPSSVQKSFLIRQKSSVICYLEVPKLVDGVERKKKLSSTKYMCNLFLEFGLSVSLGLASFVRYWIVLPLRALNSHFNETIC